MEFDSKEEQIEFLQKTLIEEKAFIEKCKQDLKQFVDAHETIFKEAKELRTAVTDAKKEFTETAGQLCVLMKEGKEL